MACRLPSRWFGRLAFVCLALLGVSPGVPAGGPAPAPVDVSRPVRRAVRDSADFTGRLQAVERVELRARVTGYLDRVRFDAGTKVKRGQLLFELDPRPLKAQLQKAEAELAVAQAGLKRSEAELARARKLFATRAISREEFDKLAGDQTYAKALVVVAQASVEVARLNLDFTQIRSPISGTIGLGRVTPGNLVLADTTPLATIVSAEPLYVSFDMDERTFLRWRRLGLGRQGKAGRAEVSVGLADERGLPRRATLEAFDNRVDPSTGTIRVRAALPNADGLLVPGLFARVRLEVGGPRHVLLVPKSAVWTRTSAARSGGTASVRVVNDKDVVERRAVKVGRELDGLVVIESGLKPDDWVVLNPKRAGPGDKVQPRRSAIEDRSGRTKD
jgi:RND family efflux transporter MFP subunit